jgi:hypothetical protein
MSKFTPVTAPSSRLKQAGLMLSGISLTVLIVVALSAATSAESIANAQPQAQQAPTQTAAPGPVANPYRPDPYPHIELTDLPLPEANGNQQVMIQAMGTATPIAAPTRPVVTASGPTTLYLPGLSNAYLDPRVARGNQPAPAPRDPEAFRVLDGIPSEGWPVATEMSESKLTVHAIGRGDPYIMQFVRSARPRLIKTVGDFGWLTEVKAIDPNILVVGRIFGQDESWVLNMAPADAARLYIEQRLSEYQTNPQIDYWEGWNEFVWDRSRPEMLTWFAQFEGERACQMQALGLRAAVGGFAVGWPNTYDEMGLFVPALEAAQRCGGIFHLHEYNRPSMFCGVASNQAGLIPGAPAITQPAGPLTLRYRFWYEGWLRPAGLADVPLVISETGIDAVPASGDCISTNPYPYDHSRFTWKHFGEWWVSQGYGPSPALAYINQLAWYDREMRWDPYVLGATIFTMGYPGSNSGWGSFDTHEATVPLANYVASQR